MLTHSAKTSAGLGQAVGVWAVPDDVGTGGRVEHPDGDGGPIAAVGVLAEGLVGFDGENLSDRSGSARSSGRCPHQPRSPSRAARPAVGFDARWHRDARPAH